MTATLDEITNDIKAMENNSSKNSNIVDGQQQRAVLGDIDKLKKVAEILETIGQAVIPVVIDSQASIQPSETAASSHFPKGIKFLQDKRHQMSESSNDD